MQRVDSGFTIIEVIIVLAVTGLLVIMSLLYMSGSIASNRFSQSMRDIQSKVQDWINDVPTGFAGSNNRGPSDVECKAIGPSGSGTPKISKVTGTRNDNGDCIYLGKAIQFTDASSPPTTDQERNVYVYSVFGIRNVSDPAGDRPSANLVEAHPVAADDTSSSGAADLTETYKLGGDSKVLSVKSSGSVPDSHLAGFYLSFNQGTASQNGSEDVRAYQYPISGNLLPGNSSGAGGRTVNDCISFDSASACKVPAGYTQAQWDQWPPPINTWTICFGNDSNNSTAVLTINSGNGIGATTKLEFKACT